MSNPLALPDSRDCGPPTCARTASGRNNTSCPCRRTANAPLRMDGLHQDEDSIFVVFYNKLKPASQSPGQFSAAHIVDESHVITWIP